MENIKVSLKELNSFRFVSKSLHVYFGSIAQFCFDDYGVRLDINIEGTGYTPLYVYFNPNDFTLKYSWLNTEYSIDEINHFNKIVSKLKQSYWIKYNKQWCEI